jgi:hypothetical protein
MNKSLYFLFILLTSFSCLAQLEERCFSTASIFLDSGDPSSMFYNDRTWNHEYLEKAVEAKIDPNGCLFQILEMAAQDEQSSYIIMNELSLEDLMLEAQTGLEHIKICENFSPLAMEDDFLYFISKVERELIQTLPKPKVKAPTGSKMCTDGLACMDKIKLAQISAQLAQLDSKDELTAKSADKVIADMLKNASDDERTRVMKALAIQAMENTIPPQEVKTLAYMHRLAKDTFDEMADMQSKADECVAANQKVQDGASFKSVDSWSSLGHNLSAPFYQAYKIGEAVTVDPKKIDWAKACLEYAEKKSIFAESIEDYLSQNELEEDKKVAIKSYYEQAAKGLSDHLVAEIGETHQSIDQVRKGALIGASGVFVAGLSVAAIAASPVLLPTIAASGGTGLITSLISGGSAVGTGAALAVEGAAIAALTEFVKPLVMVAAQNPDLRISTYCELFDQYSSVSGSNIVWNTGRAAVMSVAFGGGIGAAVAKGGRWAQAGMLGGGGMMAYGAYGMYSSHEQRASALDKLKPLLKDEKQRQCLDHAKTVANAQTAFDVAAFAAELVGPMGIEAIRGKSKSTPDVYANNHPAVKPDTSPSGARQRYRNPNLQEARTPVVSEGLLTNVTPEAVGKMDTVVKQQLIDMEIEPRVDTEMLSGFQLYSGLGGYSNNYRIRADNLPPVNNSATGPDAIALFHPEMADRIKFLEDNGYHLVVDSGIGSMKNSAKNSDGSEMGIGAYKWEPYPDGDHKVIALLPDSTWSTFEHEFQHVKFQKEYLDKVKPVETDVSNWGKYLSEPFKSALPKMLEENPSLVMDDRELMREIWELKRRGHGETGIDETLATRKERELMLEQGYGQIVNVETQLSRLRTAEYGIDHRVTEYENLVLELTKTGEEPTAQQTESYIKDRDKLAQIQTSIRPSLQRLKGSMNGDGTWKQAIDDRITLGKSVVVHLSRDESTKRGVAAAGVSAVSASAAAISGLYYHEELMKFVVTYKDGLTMEFDPKDFVED